MEATLREPLKYRERLRDAFRPRLWERWRDLRRWLFDDSLPFRGFALRPLLLLAPRVKTERAMTRLRERLPLDFLWKRGQRLFDRRLRLV